MSNLTGSTTSHPSLHNNEVEKMVGFAALAYGDECECIRRSTAVVFHGGKAALLGRVDPTVVSTASFTRD